MHKLTSYLIAAALLGYHFLSLAQTDEAHEGILKTVPGGIYAWEVPQGATDIRFNDRPVWVSRGTALVGVPLNQSRGNAEMQYQLGGKVLTVRRAGVRRRFTYALLNRP